MSQGILVSIPSEGTNSLYAIIVIIIIIAQEFTRIKLWTFFIHVKIREILNEFVIVLTFPGIILISAFI